ncbi:ABC transporter ATP-binding protein [Sinomonas sp. ASV322]|uniref:ABC transporter ATP-binding protein n=1 Tax=Sinomonas sp. ASV322 TaxID=3041920 RepID=UPI0027DCADA8|nr:ABC transporter ATP-binding protein [Sinomonas sp. ASV322]MDQ4504157.1 ABC transporter ATP-binding protein [Sinomonas sp. ASV322]
MPVIQTQGLAKVHAGPPRVRALGPVDLTVWAGEYLAVLGPSGSGKSTLLSLLGLLDVPSGGDYLLGGVDTGGLAERERTALRGRRIGFVFQDFQLLKHYTASENAALGLLYTRARASQRLSAAQAALDRVGLGAKADALASTLSGGEQQRVAIARALVGEPSILLCDEPTGNLDSATASAVLDQIDELHAQGVTVIVITHDQATAARAERRVILRDGRLFPEASP